eukprot:superscaffoldBa00001628_g11359
MPVNEAEARKRCDGLMCHPQLESEDIAPSSGHLQTLPSSLHPSVASPASPNLPSRSLLILAVLFCWCLHTSTSYNN